MVSEREGRQSRPEEFFFCLFVFFCLFLRAAPMAYGSSQGRCLTGAAAIPFTIAHGNTGSLTHSVGPGIKPASSWILVWFVTAEPQLELRKVLL